jgi:hypothetical protein
VSPKELQKRLQAKNDAAESAVERIKQRVSEKRQRFERHCADLSFQVAQYVSGATPALGFNTEAFREWDGTESSGDREALPE